MDRTLSLATSLNSWINRDRPLSLGTPLNSWNIRGESVPREIEELGPPISEPSANHLNNQNLDG